MVLNIEAKLPKKQLLVQVDVLPAGIVPKQGKLAVMFAIVKEVRRTKAINNNRKSFI